MRWFICLLLLLSGLDLSHGAPSREETKALKTAIDAFKDKLFPFAEVKLADFLAKYTNSEYRAEAILYQAQARFYQSNYPGTLQLVQQQMAAAGPLADRYQFLLAETHFQKGDFSAAAPAYALVVEKYTNSTLRLEAACNQAYSYARQQDWLRVITLLAQPQGAFTLAALEGASPDSVIRGLLLLGEAHLMQRQYGQGENLLQQLALQGEKRLSPEHRWRLNYLLCRIQLEAGRPREALQTSTNLAANSTEQRAYQAELQGAVYERLKLWPEAVLMYEKNYLNDTLPADTRRQALLKTIELTLAQNKTAEAIRRLELFIEQKGADPAREPALDLAWLTLGELRLKEHFRQLPPSPTNDLASLATNGTNLLQLAMTNFSQLFLPPYSKSPLLGKAALDLGWCHWTLNQLEAAERDFTDAYEKLPLSEDRLVALFKLGDTQFRRQRYTNAAASYQSLLEQGVKWERVRKNLLPRALYQLVRVALEQGNTALADRAMKRLLTDYPESSFGDRSVLLVGQEQSRQNASAEARQLFQDFARRFTNSTLRAEVELAEARTYLQEKNWTQAFGKFEAWSQLHPAHPWLAEAEFSRALAYARANQATNALSLFTNFVSRFATNRLAPLAQNWVADYYWNLEDFVNADKHYQLLYQNPLAPADLSYRAQLMAGRAAFAMQELKAARGYFTTLLQSLRKDTNAPPALVSETWFALGDTLFTQFLTTSTTVTNKTGPDVAAEIAPPLKVAGATSAETNAPPGRSWEGDFKDAIVIFKRLAEDNATNSLGARAWGRIGDCYWQWGALRGDTSALEEALRAYSNVLGATNAEVAAWSQAHVGIGKILENQVLLAVVTTNLEAKAVSPASAPTAKPLGEEERQKLLQTALKHYLEVVYDQGHPALAAFWLEKAAAAAARLCETREHWQQAFNVYQRAVQLVPALGPAWKKRMAQVQQHLESSRN